MLGPRRPPPGTGRRQAQAERPPAPAAPAILKQVEAAEPMQARPGAISVEALADQSLKALGEPARLQDKEDDPMVKQQIKRSLLRLRPDLRGELHFIRATCSPTPQQHRALARDGEIALTEAVRAYAVAFVQMQKGVRERPGAQPAGTLFAARMLAVAQQNLTAEQLVLYREAADRRAVSAPRGPRPRPGGHPRRELVSA